MEEGYGASVVAFGGVDEVADVGARVIVHAASRGQYVPSMDMQGARIVVEDALRAVADVRGSTDPKVQRLAVEVERLARTVEAIAQQYIR